MRDLAREFLRQGHIPVVFTPSHLLTERWTVTNEDGVEVLRISAAPTKNINFVRRVYSEFKLSYSMIRALRKSTYQDIRWDLVIWYSPTIFFGPLIYYLKWRTNCKTYLILRDIFPQWAVDVGLMSRGLPYRILDLVARFQYSVADVIGVQSRGNLSFFNQSSGNFQILSNWLGKTFKVSSPIRISETSFANRKVFVYAGNMGVAQGMDIFLDLAELFLNRTDVGFLFVGRGSDVARLSAAAKVRGLGNVLFYDEIYPEEIPDLFAQCSIGILALDHRHKSHNIPGKFLAYMQCGLPVLANINAGNDLAKMIRDERVGQVCESNQVEELLQLTQKLLTQIESDSQMSFRCQSFFQREFSVDKAVRQIIASVSG